MPAVAGMTEKYPPSWPGLSRPSTSCLLNRRKEDVVPAFAGMTWKNEYRPVMAGHSRSKNGVASLAYAPAIHVLLAESPNERHGCPPSRA